MDLASNATDESSSSCTRSGRNYVPPCLPTLTSTESPNLGVSSPSLIASQSPSKPLGGLLLDIDSLATSSPVSSMILVPNVVLPSSNCSLLHSVPAESSSGLEAVQREGASPVGLPVSQTSLTVACSVGNNGANLDYAGEKLVKNLYDNERLCDRVDSPCCYNVDNGTAGGNNVENGAFRLKMGLLLVSMQLKIWVTLSRIVLLILRR